MLVERWVNNTCKYGLASCCCLSYVAASAHFGTLQARLLLLLLLSLDVGAAYLGLVILPWSQLLCSYCRMALQFDCIVCIAAYQMQTIGSSCTTWRCTYMTVVLFTFTCRCVLRNAPYSFPPFLLQLNSNPASCITMSHMRCCAGLFCVNIRPAARVH